MIRRIFMIGTGLKERGRYNTEDCRRVDHITIEQVIVVHVLRGKGTEDDLARPVKKYFNSEGEFLFEYDPCYEGESIIMPLLSSHQK
jgi:hypothetical protein